MQQLMYSRSFLRREVKNFNFFVSFLIFLQAPALAIIYPLPRLFVPFVPVTIILASHNCMLKVTDDQPPRVTTIHHNSHPLHLRRQERDVIHTFIFHVNFFSIL